MEILWIVLRIGCIVLTLSECPGVTTVYFTSPSYKQHENRYLDYRTFERTRPPVQYVPTIRSQRIDAENSKHYEENTIHYENSKHYEENTIHYFRTTSKELAATTTSPSTIPHTNIYAKWTTNFSKTIKLDLEKKSENTTPYWPPGLDVRVSQKKISATTFVYEQKLNTSESIGKLVKNQPTEVENIISEETVDKFPENSTDYLKLNSKTNSGYNDKLKELRRRMKDLSTEDEIVEEDFTLQRDSHISQNANTVTTVENEEVTEGKTLMNNSLTQSTDTATVEDDQKDCIRKVIELLMKQSDERDREQATDSFDLIFRKNNGKGKATFNNNSQNDRSEQDEDISKSNPGGEATERLQCYSCTNDTSVNCNEAGLFTLKKYCDLHEVCLIILTKDMLTCRTSLQRSCARSDACTNRHERLTAEHVACVTCTDSLCNAGVSTFTIMTPFSAFLVAVLVRNN